jgi:hypothetical protein
MKDDEILLGLATDNRMHCFKATDDGVADKPSCGANTKYASPGTEEDLVCSDCYKAIIMWAERTDKTTDPLTIS